MVELTNEFCQTYVSYSRCLFVSFVLLALMLFSPALFTFKKYRTAKYLYGLIYYAEKGDSLRIHLPAIAATMFFLIDSLCKAALGLRADKNSMTFRHLIAPNWLATWLLRLMMQYTDRNNELQSGQRHAQASRRS